MWNLFLSHENTGWKHFLLYTRERDNNNVNSNDVLRPTESKPRSKAQSSSAFVLVTLQLTTSTATYTLPSATHKTMLFIPNKQLSNKQLSCCRASGGMVKVDHL